MEFPSTDLERSQGEQVWEEDQKLNFGHIKSEMLIRYPNSRQFKYMSLEFREEG